MKPIRVAPLAAVVLAACASGSGTPASVPNAGPVLTTAAISEADLRHRLFTIAHDSMMGRESGSRGAWLTAEYVANEFKRLGLEPAGDNGGWFQTVPLWNVAADPTSTLLVGTTTLTVGRDFIPSSLGAMPVRFAESPVIYGGLITDTATWSSPAEANGKLVVLYLPPDTPTRAVSLRRWTGAAAVALTILDNAAPEQRARQMSGRPVPDTTRNPAVIPTINVSRRAAALLLGGDPMSMRPGASPTKVSGHFDMSRPPVAFPARNVVGILRGSDPARRGQYVSLTAHNDHVGYDRFPVDHDSIRAFLRVVRPMGADSPNRQPTAEEAAKIRLILDSLRKANRPRLDSIRNGADDDGTGTVSILEIAEALANGRRPARSILFVNHTAEEAGLLGSNWFTAHPTVPLDSIVGEIDQDMVGRGTTSDFPRGGTGAGSATYLEVIGARRLSKEFGDSVEAANKRQPVPFTFDYTYDAPGHPLQYYCRADHYNYAKHGIPAMAISRGEHLDYHQVTDEPQYISYPDLARVSRMVFDAAMAIGNMTHRPALSVPKPTNPNAQCRQ